MMLYIIIPGSTHNISPAPISRRLAAGNPQKYEITGIWAGSRQGVFRMRAYVASIVGIYQSGSRFGHFMLFCQLAQTCQGGGWPTAHDARLTHLSDGDNRFPWKLAAYIRSTWMQCPGSKYGTNKKKVFLSTIIICFNSTQLMHSSHSTCPLAPISTEVAEIPVAGPVGCIISLIPPICEK